MTLPLISRRLVDALLAEKDARIAFVTAEAERLRQENHDLVNALAATRGAVAPYRKPNGAPMKSVSRPGVYQMEQRLTRLRAADEAEPVSGSGA